MGPWLAVEAFIERGGPVLYAIGGVLVVMWTLILERLWHLRTVHPAAVHRALEEWESRAERTSWHAHRIREAMISEVSLALERGLGMLQSLVGLCTLLGLLGTVTGMIQVFDVMAMTGSSSARLMASGVSRATIPTMAGMVAALSGLYASVWLNNKAKREAEELGDLLRRET